MHVMSAMLDRIKCRAIRILLCQILAVKVFPTTFGDILCSIKMFTDQSGGTVVFPVIVVASSGPLAWRSATGTLMADARSMAAPHKGLCL